MRIIGVYKIQSKIKPERVYIGSARDVFNRWKTHLSELKYNKHHSKKLQNHYNKYGETDLQFSIITSCENSDQLNCEQFFIDSLNPYFNMCKKADNCAGFKHSEETKAKMSRSSKGMKHTEETKIKIGNATRGHKVSAEARQIMSAYKIGKPTWNKGKKGIYSDETINRMKLARVGKKNTLEQNKKISDSLRIAWSKRKSA